MSTIKPGDRVAIAYTPLEGVATVRTAPGWWTVRVDDRAETYQEHRLRRVA